MAGLDNYLAGQDVPAPGSAEWLKMIGQASQLPPDQAQVMQARLRDDDDAQAARLSSQANTPLPPPVSPGQIPMVNNFKPGQGLAAYMPSATKAQDRALVDQYKAQSQSSMNDQKSGIDQLEQMRKDLSGKEIPFDWSNVGSFVDMLNGQFGKKTDLHKDAMDVRGLTQEQKDDKLLKLQEYIQGAKGNMSKEALQSTQQMLQMLHQNDQTNLMAQHYANTEKAADTRSTAFADRNTIARENQAKQVGDLFDKDPVIKPQLDRLNQITLDKHTIEMGGVISPQVMNEIGTGIATALAGGKTAGWNASEAQQLQSLAKDFAARRQYIENKPFNALSADNAEYMTKVLSRLEGGYGNAISRRADQLRQGRDYPANPLAVKTMNEKHDFYTAFGKQQTPQAPAAIAAPGDLHSLSDDDLLKQYNALGK